MRAILPDPTTGTARVFTNPVAVRVARTPGDVPALLQRVEGDARTGRYAVGFVSYEAAPGFDPALCAHALAPGVPAAWFGIFEEPARAALETCGRDEPVPWRADTAYPAYEAAVARIRALIAAGDTYQVNYTLRMDARFDGDPWGLFRRLYAAQPVEGALYIETDDWAVCSVSPELFFERSGRCVAVRPMKGTAPRGLSAADDRSAGEALGHSVKDRAENVMIVDMMRNDLGRVAVPGSIAVQDLFAVDRYPTVWQMTSSISAETAASLPEIFRALFPCASVTGAPKRRTMEIIAGLETSPRGVYTGAVGWIRPGGDARFQVAIRTAWIDRRRGTAGYGTGSGIVWDSAPRGEYEECMVKARILQADRPEFELLETLRRSRDGRYLLQAEHLRRLAASAEYFQIPLDAGQVRRALHNAAAAGGRAAQRIRLLVSRTGHVRWESAPLEPRSGNGPVRLRLAGFPVDRRDPFLYHKTTRRQVYDEARASRPDAEDVILWNEEGECTETTIANLVVEQGGRRWTPPVASGLLPGIFREVLTASGLVRERVLRTGDLRRAGRLWIVNSVRGWQPAEYVPD